MPGFIAPSERHFICLPGLGLAYARVPKAANSSIRAALARHLPPDARPAGLAPRHDLFWHRLPPEAGRALTRKQFAAQAPRQGLWAFTFVRDPVARLYSAWNNKVIENAAPGAGLAALGVEHGMSFEAFVACIARSSDAGCDVHVRSQSALLVLRERVLPDFIGHVETLAQDWAQLRAQVQARGGPDLGPLGQHNRRVGARPEIADTLAPATLAAIRTRYLEDFRRFYPASLARIEARIGARIGASGPSSPGGHGP